MHGHDFKLDDEPYSLPRFVDITHLQVLDASQTGKVTKVKFGNQCRVIKQSALFSRDNEGISCDDDNLREILAYDALRYPHTGALSGTFNMAADLYLGNFDDMTGFPRFVYFTMPEGIGVPNLDSARPRQPNAIPELKAAIAGGVTAV
jgi:hypothetical protein